MTALGTPDRPLRVAIVGSGPAGFYAAEHLLKRKDDMVVEFDMFDRLPTPYGLVRFGVAPDHQKIKNVTRVFDRIAGNERFRFFGNVDIGSHLTLDDLKQHFHQVCFATGAQTDRQMGIPGEDLKRSHPATEFVAWYNGHPEFRDLEFDLSVERAAVVGVGNVAVDVARQFSPFKRPLLIRIWGTILPCRSPDCIEGLGIRDGRDSAVEQFPTCL